MRGRCASLRSGLDIFGVNLLSVQKDGQNGIEIGIVSNISFVFSILEIGDCNFLLLSFLSQFCGKSTTIVLKDLKNGSYEGDFEVKPEHNAVVTASLNGQQFFLEEIKASRPQADLHKTSVTVVDGKVTIKAKTAEGAPARHSDGHFIAKLEQNGKEVDIPLVNHGDGTYSGSFTVPDPKKDAIVRVFHDGAHIGESPYVIPRVPAKVSASRSTAKLEGDKVIIQAYDDDGDVMTSGGDKFRVEVLQEGKKTVVPVKDNKDGTYISASLPLVPTEDAVIEVTHERQPIFGTPFNIKASLVFGP